MSGATMVGLNASLAIVLRPNRGNKRLGRDLGKLTLGLGRFLRTSAAALGLLHFGFRLKRRQIRCEQRDEFFHRLLHWRERARGQEQQPLLPHG